MKFTQAIKKNWLLQKIPWTNNKFKVMDEFVRYVDYTDKSAHIIVPEGFITDFGSIPRLFHWLFNPTKYISYILHDYLYSYKWCVLLPDDFNERWITWVEKLKVEYEYWDNYKVSAIPDRLFADRTLIEWMRVEWAGIIERYIVYIFVRIFWFLFFKKSNGKNI